MSNSPTVSQAAANGAGFVARAGPTQQVNLRLLPIRANSNSRTVEYVDGGENVFDVANTTNGSIIWNESLDFTDREIAENNVGDYLNEKKVNKLIDEKDGTINKAELVQLVESSGGNVEWASYVATVTNTLPPLVPRDWSEMLLQQQLFHPVTHLLYCFSSKRFTADLNVSSGFQYTETKNFVAESCTYDSRPDAALHATGRKLVLAMMESKSQTELNLQDVFDCVIHTSITAAALIQYGVIADDEKVAVPFVVNVGELAHLFITTATKVEPTPVIKRLCCADFSDAKEKSKFIAYLAVLLSTLVDSMKTKGNRLIGRLSLLVRERSTKRSSGNDHTPSGSSSKKKKEVSSAARAPATKGGRVSAEAVAACDGKIVDRYYHHTDSPFYFSGVHKSNGRDVPVFVKVWRSGDSRTKKKFIQSEIDLLKQAHQLGVPCPAVVQDLTRVSLDYANEEFHRLVMHKLPDDAVLSTDLKAYGVSLIQSVILLHQIGLLHCDLKRSNTVWNSGTKITSLVDFGHAQKEVGARPCTGTEGLTAPEVMQNGEPHSRRTEAYSVGKTLTYMCLSLGVTSEESRGVQRLGEKLSREDPGMRITLEEALGELMASGTVRATSEPETEKAVVTPDALDSKRLAAK